MMNLWSSEKGKTSVPWWERPLLHLRAHRDAMEHPHPLLWRPIYHHNYYNLKLGELFKAMLALKQRSAAHLYTCSLNI
jgi:hypothetical protein